MKQEGEWELAKARRRVKKATDDFAPFVAELRAFFGDEETEKELEKIKKNTKMMMLSNRPVEKNAADAWYEVR